MQNRSLFYQYFGLFFLVCLVMVALYPVGAGAQVYRFGVINKQSVMTTIAFWNPILAWLEKETGLELELSMGVSSAQTQQRLREGKYDFFVGYPLLEPDVRKQLGYRVLLKERGVEEQSAIVVRAASPYNKLADLNGVDVLSAPTQNFIAGFLPLFYLTTRDVYPVPQVVPNQESLVLKFLASEKAAALVNFGVFRKHVPDGDDYRLLWASPMIPSLPVGVKQAVPVEDAEKVRLALMHMSKSTSGKAVLDKLRQGLGVNVQGWALASDEDYVFAISMYEQAKQRE